MCVTGGERKRRENRGDRKMETERDRAKERKREGGVCRGKGEGIERKDSRQRDKRTG